MSYNGSGVFVINSTGQPVTANTLIEAAVFNALTTDIANGLSTAITKDGQTTVTANIPMGGYKFTGLGAGTTAGDSVRYEQVALLTANNTLTGANTFRNAAGIRSEQASTQDAIAIVGRAGGTDSYEVTITPDTLTADRTLTAPDVSGTIATAPTAFRVHRNGTDQTGVATSTWTKFAPTTEAFDYGSCYDLATDNRFEAVKAGPHMFSGATVPLNAIDGMSVGLAFWVNGSAVAQFWVRASYTGTFVGVTGSVVVNLAVNDYVEMYIYHGRGTNEDFSGTATDSFFCGSSL